jgi:hypothetical protein
VDSAIEVRYAGVTVGRATHVRDWTETGAFIGFAEPLPTGTPVELRGDGARKTATVEEVIESADPAIAGMRVRFFAASTPAGTPASTPASTPEGTPVVVAVEPSVPEASEAHAAEPGESGPNPGAGGGGKRRRRRR